MRQAAVSLYVPFSDEAFAFGVTLIRSFLKPYSGLCRILSDAKSAVIDFTHTNFRF